ncbi:MAG: DUF3299 domain-containing protein [Planctomycetota bacterium]
MPDALLVMNVNLLPLSLILVAMLTIGCEQERAESDAPAPAEHSADVDPAVTAVGEAADEPEAEPEPQPEPVLDFPLLDAVRWLDLVDRSVRFPESLKVLDGRRVSLVGFMAPFDSLQDMRRCMIVPAYVGCQFCSPPTMTQVVYVTQGDLDDGSSARPFIEEPSQVVGTLRLSLPESEHEGKEQGFLYSIERAVVTPYTGEAPERAPGHGSTPPGQSTHLRGATELEPVEMADLVEQVGDLLGRQPLRPIEVEPVDRDAFAALVRGRLEATFPPDSQAAWASAFSLLGMLDDDAEWIPTLAGIELARRVTATDEAGEHVVLLDSVPVEHAYVRLELVGAIADAIVRQHFPRGEAPADHDGRRALEALHRGIRTVATYRYSRSRGISPSTELPVELEEGAWDAPPTSLEMDFWQFLPADVGSFFVDYFVGATGPFSDLDPAISRPPTTTIEFFRPRWYEDSALWRHDPVPETFADDVMESPPTRTEVLGIGGLVPWLASWHSVDVAKLIAGTWAGDRYAVWRFEDGSSVLLLETRWQDDASAEQFHGSIPDDPHQSVAPYVTGSRTVRMFRGSSAEALARVTREGK